MLEGRTGVRKVPKYTTKIITENNDYKLEESLNNYLNRLEEQQIVSISYSHDYYGKPSALIVTKDK